MSRWPAVSVNGSAASKASSSPPGPAGRGTPGTSLIEARRCARVTCRVSASSHVSRVRAADSSSGLAGRWMLCSAASRSISACPARISAGIGSAGGSRTSSTVRTQRPIVQDFSSAVAG